MKDEDIIAVLVAYDRRVSGGGPCSEFQIIERHSVHDGAADYVQFAFRGSEKEGMSCAFIYNGDVFVLDDWDYGYFIAYEAAPAYNWVHAQTGEDVIFMDGLPMTFSNFRTKKINNDYETDYRQEF